MEREGPIVTDPQVMMGKPTVAGTRIAVDLILEKLAAGETPEQLLRSYPRLSEDGLRAALHFAWVFLNNFADALRSGRVGPGLRQEKWNLRDALVVLYGDVPGREGPFAAPGEFDGGPLGSLLRKVDASGVEFAQAVETLDSISIDEAAYLLEESVYSNWEEFFSRGRGRGRGPEEVRVVLAFASEALRNAYGRRRRPRL